MAKNRFADIRYRTLDKCLRDKNKHYSIYDLVEQCSKAIFQVDEIERNPISSKQIRKDLDYLESDAGYKAEIERYRLIGDKKVYFRYIDPNFSISQRPLNDKDAENLRNALSTLQRFKGLPQFDWIEEFTARVQELNDLGDVKETAISFDRSNFLEGLKWIDKIYHAIINHTTLRVEYSPFDKPKEIHLISPYLLKQYNRRWFVLCKTDLLDYLTNLALDRIINIEPSPYQFIPYPEESAEDFFEDIIGVTNFADKNIQIISLEVEKSLYPYIKTKPIHDSQKIIKSTEDKDWVRIELNIKTNYEFYSVILSHGPRIRIISPESVKEKMKSFIMEMVKNY